MSILINAQLLRTLEQGADLIVTEAKQNTPTKKIDPAIHRDSAEQDSATSASVRIWIDLNEAPMARAYEKGSGIHATQGEKGTYRIPDENGGAYVAFPRSRWPKYQPPPDKDNFVFTFVNHPGVAAQPYMKPAFEDKKSEVAGLLLNTLRDNIKSQIRLTWNEAMK